MPFDAGPIHLWKTNKTGIDLKDCLNIKIEEHSIGLFLKAVLEKDNKELKQLASEIKINDSEETYEYTPRFAIYSKIQKNLLSGEVGINHTFARASVSPVFEKKNLDAPRLKFLNKLKELYQDEIVIAEEGVVGIVHDRTRLAVLRKAEEEKNKELTDFIKQMPENELGTSSEFVENMFNFTNRGGMFKSIMDLNKSAKYALFLLVAPFDNKSNCFLKEEKTFESHLSRSVIEKIMHAITTIISEEINQYIVKYHLPISQRNQWCSYNKNTCYSYQYTDFWEKHLRHNERNLAEFYLRNIYIVAGFDPEQKPGEHWPKKLDEEIILEMLESAQELGLTLHLNKIPHYFKFSPKLKGQEFSSTVLMYAARRNSGMLILKLIEMGADYTLEDKEGNNALSYAKKRSMQNSDIITYLETLQSLHTAIFSDEKRNEHHPIHQVLKDIDKTMHLDKPFYKGKTALMCAAEFKNPFLLNSILDKLENLGIDEPSIPAAHTALFVSARCGNFANAIELLKCGANPALVTKHPDFSEFVDNDNIIYLLEKWQDPPTLKAVLENIISTLQQFELTSKDTQNLEKELIIGLESKESNVIFNTIIKLFEKIDFTIYIDDFDEFPIIQIYKEIYDSIESDKVSASYSPVYLIDPIPKIDTLDSFPFEENDTNIGPTPMSVLNDLASLINSYEEGVEIEDTFDSVNSPRNTFVYFPDEVPVLPASEIPNFQSGGSSRRRSIFAEPITPASQYESDQENIDSIQMNSPR